MGRKQRAKGARGERQAAKALARLTALVVRRTAQRTGRGTSTADVEGIPGVSIEVKVGQRCKGVTAMMAQAEESAAPATVPVVVMRADRGQWLAVVRLNDWRPAPNSDGGAMTWAPATEGAP